MDIFNFNEEIMGLIEVWKSRGECIHKKGARLIGHLPEIGKEVYMHIVFPPLPEKYISEFRSRLAGREIPDSYLSLLMFANGMYLFPHGIHLYGYTPLNHEISNSFLDFPSNIMIDNGQLMVKGSEPLDITIGFYGSDRSYINIKSDGRIIRFKPGLPMQIVDAWPDLKSWLIEEITRLTLEWQQKLKESE